MTTFSDLAAVRPAPTLVQVNGVEDDQPADKAPVASSSSSYDSRKSSQTVRIEEELPAASSSSSYYTTKHPPRMPTIEISEDEDEIRIPADCSPHSSRSESRRKSSTTSSRQIAKPLPPPPSRWNKLPGHIRGIIVSVVVILGLNAAACYFGLMGGWQAGFIPLALMPILLLLWFRAYRKQKQSARRGEPVPTGAYKISPTKVVVYLMINLVLPGVGYFSRDLRTGWYGRHDRSVIASCHHTLPRKAAYVYPPEGYELTTGRKIADTSGTHVVFPLVLQPTNRDKKSCRVDNTWFVCEKPAKEDVSWCLKKIIPGRVTSLEPKLGDEEWKPHSYLTAYEYRGFSQMVARGYVPTLLYAGAHPPSYYKQLFVAQMRNLCALVAGQLLAFAVYCVAYIIWTARRPNPSEDEAMVPLRKRQNDYRVPRHTSSTVLPGPPDRFAIVLDALLTTTVAKPQPDVEMQAVPVQNQNTVQQFDVL
eukprot:NODE_354_length_1603_cov_10.023713_g322_i0.p1 GENE.NODE_354_length_1603_cov_10.023713_g322_i0~~NODE_354_length_1603_cov_10.023713_g322_i0.p1  ORF type:complete len:498 (-),score=61.54 NODE_354_length_1603_cov_10.023713_g322_i0:109-1539(-)